MFSYLVVFADHMVPRMAVSQQLDNVLTSCWDGLLAAEICLWARSTFQVVDDKGNRLTSYIIQEPPGLTGQDSC